MSRMVSRWTADVQSREIQGYMDSRGEIKYSFISLGRNRGLLTKGEKEQLISSGLYTNVFNKEEEAKEEFEIFGGLL